MFSFVLVAEYGAPWTGAPGPLPNIPAPMVVTGPGAWLCKKTAFPPSWANTQGDADKTKAMKSAGFMVAKVSFQIHPIAGAAVVLRPIHPRRSSGPRQNA